MPSRAVRRAPFVPRITAGGLAIVMLAIGVPAACADERRRPEASNPTALDSAIQAATSRDSLRNGALIGAIVGGAATFGFVMYVCEALKEEGNPPCLPPSLLVGALGAGVGAAAGAGIDVLLTRTPASRVPRPASPAVRLSIRF